MGQVGLASPGAQRRWGQLAQSLPDPNLSFPSRRTPLS